MTTNDIKKMEDNRIEYRKLVVRKKALDDVKVARGQGDQSARNFNSQGHKSSLRTRIKSLIRYIEEMIKDCRYHIQMESNDDEGGYIQYG